MPRLIDADALLRDMETLWDWPTVNGIQTDTALRQVMTDIRNAPTVGGWVSVKDRLPEERINPLTQDFAEVICFCDFGGEPRRTDVRTIGFGKTLWDDAPHFWRGGVKMDSRVTHWMPLPEPPEVTEDADRDA